MRHCQLIMNSAVTRTIDRASSASVKGQNCEFSLAWSRISVRICPRQWQAELPVSSRGSDCYVWREKHTEKDSRVHSTLRLASSSRRAQTICCLFLPEALYIYSYVTSLIKTSLGYRASKIRRPATFFVLGARHYGRSDIYCECSKSIRYHAVNIRMQSTCLLIIIKNKKMHKYLINRNFYFVYKRYIIEMKRKSVNDK